jgi:competence protein ComEA
VVGKAVREAAWLTPGRPPCGESTRQTVFMKEVAMTLRRFVTTGLALAMAALLVSGPAIAAGKPAPTAKVNINTATVEQLTTLPGVGPRLAARVIEYRQKTPFRSTQELMNVKGIGEKNFAKIESWLTVGEGSKAASK